VRAVNATSGARMDNEGGGTNAGWIAGVIVILAVLAIGGALWFTFHP
jgi:hypothetical protein